MGEYCLVPVIGMALPWQEYERNKHYVQIKVELFAFSLGAIIDDNTYQDHIDYNDGISYTNSLSP